MKTRKKLSSKDIIQQLLNYYEDIISCMPGNVYWLNKNAITLGCNKNVLDMFGFKNIDDFRGLSFEDMGRLGKWSLEATQKFKQDTLGVIQNGTPKLNLEEPPIPHSDGRMISFLTSRVPLFDYQYQVIGVVGISVDITERKKMERELKIAKEQAESALRAKEEAERALREKSVDLQKVLQDMIQQKYYLTGKYKGIYLTKREAECLVCLARNMSVKEIAKVLKIKPRTVEMFLENARGKLNCHTKSQLVQAAIECRFLEGVRPVI